MRLSWDTEGRQRSEPRGRWDPQSYFPNAGPTTRDTFCLLKLLGPWPLVVKSEDLSTCVVRAQEAARPPHSFSDSLSPASAVAVGLFVNLVNDSLPG